jgi:hypothetical protein
MRLRTLVVATWLFALASSLPALAQSSAAGGTAKTLRDAEISWTMTLARDASDERVVTIERVVPWDIDEFSSVVIAHDYGKGCYTLDGPDSDPSDVGCAEWFNREATLTSSQPSYSESTDNYSITVAGKGKKISVTIVLPEAFLSDFANFVQVWGRGHLPDGSTRDFTLSLPIVGLYYR